MNMSNKQKQIKMKKLIDYFTPTTKDDAELGKAMLIITAAILIIIYLANI